MLTLFDSRSSIPLSRKDVHSGKALCLKWMDSNNIKLVSGGSDCCIKITSLNDSK